MNNCKCELVKDVLRSEFASLHDIRTIFEYKMPTKVLDYKPYNSIGHLPGSRTGESDSTIDKKQADFFTKEFPPIKCVLYLEEKMDGTNVSVVRKNGKIIPIGRSGYPCHDSNQEQHRMFYRWLMSNIDKFEKLLPGEDDRVVGEWMALAHGTIYPNLKSPFMAFDLYRNKVQQNVAIRRLDVEDVGLFNVPLLWLETSSAISTEDALNILNTINPDAEGVVYRLEKRKKGELELTDTIPWMIAKLVKMDKEDGKYFKYIDENGQQQSKKPDEYLWNWKENA